MRSKGFPFIEMHKYFQNISCLKEIPILAWTLILGTSISSLLSNACIPFLAIILAKNNASPILIGLIIGVAPFTGIIFGFYLSALSDLFGRKVIILISLYVFTFAYLLLAINHFPADYFLVSALIGLCSSVFEPTSQALLSDIIPTGNIKRVFLFRYFMLNIGFALGPLLGALLALYNEKLSFYVAACLFGVYAIFMSLKMRDYKESNAKSLEKRSITGDIVRVLLKDRVFTAFLFGAICVSITYSQFGSIFPQYIHAVNKSNFVFSVMLMINGFGVLIFQRPFTAISTRLGVLRGMMVGGVFIFIGYVVIAISHTYTTLLFLGILIITFGELLVTPLQNVVVNHLATPSMYGLYYGAYTLRQLGYALGPVLGGGLLKSSGGQTTFFIIGLFGLFASCFFGFVKKTIALKDADYHPFLK
jgi:MFS family permease